MKTSFKLTYIALLATLSCLVILINGCFGGNDKLVTPPVSPNNESPTTVPIIYKKVPNVVGFPVSSAKIKLADTGFTPTVPSIYFGGGNRFVASQNPPAGTLVPKDSNIVIALGLSSEKLTVSPTTTTTIATGTVTGGVSGGGTGPGGTSGGGAGSTTTTTTVEKYADLYIKEIKTDPIEPDAGEETEIRISVTNGGNTNAQPFVLFFSDNVGSDDSGATSSADSSCMFPGKENRHNRIMEPGETLLFRCNHEWSAPGVYDMLARIDYDAAGSTTASSDKDDDDKTDYELCLDEKTLDGFTEIEAKIFCNPLKTSEDIEETEDATIEDSNPTNDKLKQSILIGGDIDTVSADALSVDVSMTSSINSSTTLPLSTSTTTSSTTTLPVNGNLKYSNYTSKKLGFSVEHPEHWLKGQFNISASGNEEYFIDTAPGLAGNSISVTTEAMPVTTLEEAFTYQIQKVTEESGFPPFNIAPSKVGSAGSFTYDVLTDNPGHSSSQTISQANGKIWLITYTASDHSYDDDLGVFTRFLSSFKY